LTGIARTPELQVDRTPCEPWGFWTTTAYGLTAIAAWFAVQLLAASLVLAVFGAGRAGFEVQILASHALTIAVATILSMPAPLAVIAIGARFARCTVRDYLALYDRRCPHHCRAVAAR
jgi:hypothetical protein